MWKCVLQRIRPVLYALMAEFQESALDAVEKSTLLLPRQLIEKLRSIDCISSRPDLHRFDMSTASSIWVKENRSKQFALYHLEKMRNSCGAHELEVKAAPTARRLHLIFASSTMSLSSLS